MEPPPKMEAGAATAVSDTATTRDPWPPARRPRPAPPVAKDAFSLGYRYRAVTSADGREDLEQVPLTEEDLIYPQEGDHVTQAVPHFSFLHPRADAMRRYLEKRPGLVSPPTSPSS